MRICDQRIIDSLHRLCEFKKETTGALITPLKDVTSTSPFKTTLTEKKAKRYDFLYTQILENVELTYAKNITTH